MKIGYHIKGDLKKEFITQGTFPSMQEAIVIFSRMKNLSEIEFLKLYAVVKVKD